jgi:hypothetical protein
LHHILKNISKMTYSCIFRAGSMDICWRLKQKVLTIYFAIFPLSNQDISLIVNSYSQVLNRVPIASPYFRST